MTFLALRATGLRILSVVRASQLAHPSIMKSPLKLVAAVFAACCLTVTAFAAEASPTGTWKWTIQGRQGGQGFEQTLKLDYKDGKLTGTLLGVQGNQFSVPDTPIADASFKDGTLKFTVTREFNSNKSTTKYEGKLEGDSIKGTYERPGLDGGAAVKREWDAKRAK
jgi:hypothetical protein